MPRRGVRILPAHQATIKAERHIGPVSRAEQSLCSEGNFLASALKAESACAQRDTAFGKGLDNIEVILIDRPRTALVITKGVVARTANNFLRRWSPSLQFPQRPSLNLYKVLLESSINSDEEG
jgi:hypothetical protein